MLKSYGDILRERMNAKRLTFGFGRVRRPLEDKSETELIVVVSRILANPGTHFTPSEYADLMAVNWELFIREQLAVGARPNLGQRSDHGRQQ